MDKLICFLLLTWACVHAFPVSDPKQDEENDEGFIESMYKKEIEEGDNAEDPMASTKNIKHHLAKKQHLHGHFDVGAPYGHINEPHGLGMDFPVSHVHDMHGPIGYPITHHGHGMHHGYGMHHGQGMHHGHGLQEPVVISPGHGHELPIIFPHHHHHHEHQVHHPHHAGYYPGYMPMPYHMPLCVMDKEDDKKKDDKKKDDKKEKGKKTKRQLIPCHYYGPPGAGWGAFQPGHTGAGWGAPYWY